MRKKSIKLQANKSLIIINTIIKYKRTPLIRKTALRVLTASCSLSEFDFARSGSLEKPKKF